jgi:hypothetical protein
MGRNCLLSGTIVLILSALVTAAPPKKSSRWYSWLNPFKKAEAPAAERPHAKAGEPAMPVESPAARSAREKADWLRRSAVCTQLLDIALETNDEQLRRWAEDLNTRAWDMYLKRSGQMPIAGQAMPVNTSAAQLRSRDDAQVEQSYLRSGPRARGAGQE